MSNLFMDLARLKKNQTGFSLVELLVSIFIVIVILLGIYGLINYALKITAENKLRLGAIMLANQKMEQVRNLPYNSIGTLGGIPTGTISDNETVANNNGIFYVNTFVQYKDDPFDGTLGGSPDDLLPTDYKQIRIRVAWNGPFGFKNVISYTNVAPRGMETSAGGGILSVLVYDASGLPVEVANIHIENNLLVPAINIDAETNAGGRIDLPGAPESIESYEIIVSKTGYSTSSTTARSLENPNPTLVHATVLDEQKTEMFFAIDLLGGLTIKTVTADLPQNWQANNDLSGENQINGRLVIDQLSNIYLVWQDYRQSSASKIYAQKYDLSANAQWPSPAAPADQNISTANNTVSPDILADSAGNLYVAWHDGSSGNQEAYLVKRNSADGSDVWGTEKKINTLADPADQTYPRLALADSGGNNATTTVVWQDNRNSDFDIFIQKFNYNGVKQWSPEIRANTNAVSDGSDQYEPAIAADTADNIYLVWSDTRDGDLNVYAAKYDTNGQPLWTPTNVLINTDGGSSDQYSADIAIDSGGNVYLVWSDTRDGDLNIYAAKYDASGQPTWTPTNVLINTDGGSSDQYSPSLAIDQNNIIYFVWTDERNGNQDIYAQKYDALGNNLWPADVRISIASGTAAQINPDLAIDPVTNEPYASWEDNRNGDFDVYATKFSDYLSSETTLASVPVTVLSAKQIGENPVINKYKHTHTTDSNGIITLNNFEWDSYDLSLQTGYGLYELIMANPAIPVYLPPAGNVEIILYLE